MRYWGFAYIGSATRPVIQVNAESEERAIELLKEKITNFRRPPFDSLVILEPMNMYTRPVESYSSTKEYTNKFVGKF